MIETATVTQPSFAELFAAHHHSLVRLAGLLGADDPEDIAQEAFSRLRTRRLRDDGAALAYLRSTVCDLTRNRLRHLRLVRLRRPDPPEPVRSSEHAVLVSEEHRELLAAVDRPPRRQREALVLRYRLDLSERENVIMGIARADVARVTFAFPGGGKPSPSLPGPLPGERLSDLLTAERPVRWSTGASTGATAWYGYGPARPGQGRAAHLERPHRDHGRRARPVGPGRHAVRGADPEGRRVLGGHVHHGLRRRRREAVAGRPQDTGHPREHALLTPRAAA